MLQFFAVMFFLIALVAPLALIAVTLQQSGRAVLDALHGKRERGRPARWAMRLRIRPMAPATARAPMRAAA